MMRLSILTTAAFVVAACAAPPPVAPEPEPEYYGTLEPFASEAVYFLLTDRFVDGDPSNNYPDQGGAERGTFDRPIHLDGQPPANIGYLGGDFQGIVDNADYIADMGFTAVWITPIVDNPNEAFTGGIRPGEGFGADKGKTGYHGYWGVNFFVEDEHLVSPALDFRALTERLAERDLKVVLDVVCNHGSPAYTMPEDQPMYGELYDARGTLIADHQNLHPGDLDPDNPLHAFFNREPDLAQLADMNENNPEVLEYFVEAYSQWIEQGAAAFRVDTIKHMPHAFWREFAAEIRARHPGFFMFAESYSFDARQIAEHTWPQNGGISVLDFPGKAAMNAVFADGAPYSELQSYLHLDSRLYQNPYELMTFYDNHDMPRMDAAADDFIDAHNWLFTSRGIPVVYYGSETAFRAGTSEHGGNRDYFGQARVDAAKDHRIRYALANVARLRQQLPALQRGLQLDLHFDADTAAFIRVLNHGGVRQTALVVLNRGDAPFEQALDDLGPAVAGLSWRDAASGAPLDSGSVQVDAHGVAVLLTDAVPSDAATRDRLDRLQAAARRD